jgi:predicted ATPase
MNGKKDRKPPMIELNPQLLTRPFEVQTSWHVITGAPCCGKTTVIEQLATAGYQTVPETGRRVVEREIARGRTLDEIRADVVGFDRMIRELETETERNLDPQAEFFLDRGIPDCLAFYQLGGRDPNTILPGCFAHRYASVFVLDRFPVQKDAARIENEAEADFLDHQVEHVYRQLGYAVIRVPVLSPRGRMEFILARRAVKD